MAKNTIAPPEKDVKNKNTPKELLQLKQEVR